MRSTIFWVSDKGEPSNWRHEWGQPSFECPRNLSPARMLFHHTTDTLLPINCDSMEGVFGQKWKTVGPGDVDIFPLPIGGFSGVVAIEAKTHISTSWIRHSLKTLRGVKRPEIRRCDTKKRFSGRILYTNPQVDEFYWDVFFSVESTQPGDATNNQFFLPWIWWTLVSRKDLAEKIVVFGVVLVSSCWKRDRSQALSPWDSC